MTFSEEIGFDSQFLEDPEFNNVLEDLLAGGRIEISNVYEKVN